MDAAASPRVFISYAPDSDAHVALVSEFYGFLRNCGVDAHLDSFKVENLEIAARARENDFLVIIASPQYRCFADGDLAVAQEWRVWINERMRARSKHAPTTLPVILPGGAVDDIPEVLRSGNIDYYTIADFSVTGSAALLWLMLGQWLQVPPLGAQNTSTQNSGVQLPKWATVARKARNFARATAKAIKRVAQLGNEFVERISNWFVWAVGGGIIPLLCIWLLNIKKESSAQALLGNGELFIVSAVLVAATYGELLREKKALSNKTTAEDKTNKTPNAKLDDGKKKLTWPSQVSKFACFASGLGAIAGYGGVVINGPKVTMYLSIAVFLLALVTGASIMNGIEKNR